MCAPECCGCDACVRSCGDVFLARAATRTLARHDCAPLEDLAAPDAPRLPALDGAGEAGQTCRAVPAETFGHLELGRTVGEPEFTVLHSAGQVLRTLLGQRVQRLDPDRIDLEHAGCVGQHV